MTMFDMSTPDVDKKLQEIEDEDMRSVMVEQGYSEEQIKIAIRNTHLLDEINSLKEILCEPEEIVSTLQEKGWEKEEIEKFKHELEIEYNKALNAVVQLPPVIMTGGIFVLIFKKGQGKRYEKIIYQSANERKV